MRICCSRVAVVLAMLIVVSCSAFAQGGTAGSLKGRVQLPDGSAVAGAVVKLETGQTAITDPTGNFHILDVAPGPHTVRVETPGYKPAGGKVTVEAGKTRSLLVETRHLSGEGNTVKPTTSAKPSTRPAEVRKGTLSIHAYTKTYAGKRAYVSKIEVWEQGNRNHTWTQTWWSDTGDTYRYLSCPGAVLGKTYKIAIQWKSAAGGSRYGTWIKEMYSSSQTETFYHP